jgi:AcrR family transcriptional regulator
MAAELGTSARMLVHHFGSKDDLIAAAVGEARERQRRVFQNWLDDHAPAADLPALLRSFFELIQSAEAQPYLRLFSEVYSIVLHQPDRFPSFSTVAAVHEWLPRLEEVLRAGGADEADLTALATLALAVQRGLLLDLLGTGEHERVRDANDALVRRLDVRG